ncbi:hypothetical protein CsSME_00013546 [Camellia sinensis var. sinensis]
MLYIIGLGLGNEKDITLRVYMEAYTSLLSFGLSSNALSTLQKLYAKLVNRETVKEKVYTILSKAHESDIKLGVDVKVVHNASVMNGVRESSLESLCRGRKQYVPPRYMTIRTAIEQLLEVEQMRGESGSEDQMVVVGSMKKLLTVDFGEPLHCLVIVGETHPVEDEMLGFYTLGEGK